MQFTRLIHSPLSNTNNYSKHEFVNKYFYYCTIAKRVISCANRPTEEEESTWKDKFR